MDLTNYNLKTSEGLAQAIAHIFSEKKGKDITTIKLTEKSVIADCFVVVSVSSTTAVKAIADTLEEELEKYGIRHIHRDAGTKWIALDYANVIAHIFHHEIRDFYNIERLWIDGDNLKKG